MVQEVGECVYELEYVTPDGRKLRASLEATDCNGCGTPWQTTHDPLWRTTASEHRQVWLGYTGGDGNLWWTKVHASYSGPPGSPAPGTIECWFEHRGPGNPPGGNPKNLPDGTSDGVKTKLGYFGWDGQPWLATIRSAKPGTSPCFKVEPRR